MILIRYTTPRTMLKPDDKIDIRQRKSLSIKYQNNDHKNKQRTEPVRLENNHADIP